MLVNAVKQFTRLYIKNVLFQCKEIAVKRTQVKQLLYGIPNK